AVKQTLNRLQTYAIVDGVIILDAEITPILSIPAGYELPAQLQKEILNTERVSQEHRTFVATQLKDQDGEILGYFLIGFTYETMNAEIRWALLYAIGVGIIILLPVLGIIFWQVTRWTRPLEQTTEVLNALAAGDLDRRLEIVADDEVGQLFKSFNEMAEKIRKKTVSDMQARVETAETANRMKSEFLANISHELRTPMNAILGFSELLNNQVEDEVLKNYSNAILASGKGLLTLINDILDLSKIEAGKLEIEYLPVDPRALLTEIVAIYHLQAAEKNLSFDLDLDPDLPDTLFLDAVRLRQILVNLIGNAIKFTNTGGVIVRVIGRRLDQDQHMDLILEVKDTGIGIPNNQLSEIFDSFVQQSVGINREYGGTGLGLTITRRLVKMMDGQISVTSVLDHGSTFKIHFPNIQIASQDQVTDPLKGEAFESANLNFENQTVLLVEDNEMNRELTREYLEGKGIKVVEAEDGEIALQVAPKCDPDAILMDLQMPVLNGFETTRRLRAMSQFQTTPIIALTANAMQEDRDNAMAAGCTDFLAKPMALSDLIEMLSHYFSTSEHGAKTPSDKLEPDTSLPPASNPLSNSEKEAYHTLIQSLKTERMDRWTEITDIMVPREIQTFGEEISALGTQHRLADLETWGNELARYAENFRIEDLNKALRQFPDLVDRIENQIKSLDNPEVFRHAIS
ncbi:MAG: response regulator, partial [bacterium]|nr:response regulator [bacterium]